MIAVSPGITIDRPPQAVFDFVSDPANLPRWNPVFRLGEWTSTGPPGIGAGYRARVKALGPTKEVRAEVIAWDPPRSFGYALRTPLFPIERLEVVLTLEPEGHGTRVSYDSRSEVVSALRFLRGLLVKMARKETTDNLGRLKRVLEAG